MFSELLTDKGVSQYHVKYYLKNKSITFTETHPCLKLSLPSYVFGAQWNTEWSKLNESITSVYVNKVTGNFVCPDMTVLGSWTQLEILLNTWIEMKKSQKAMTSLTKLPTVSKLSMKLPDHARILWDEATPIDSLSALQFKKLLANFKLVQRDFMKDNYPPGFTYQDFAKDLRYLN